MSSSQETARSAKKDFFLAHKRVGQNEFSNSSIAYGFQISTIYPFLFWGASSFLIVPITNSVCWGVGILLFYLSYQRIERVIDSGNSLPGLLGEKYCRETQVTASGLTIVGFSGYIIAELWIGSRIVFAVYPESDFALYYTVGIAISATLLYLGKYGQRASIVTDQIQIILSYLGILGVFVYLLFIVVQKRMPVSSFLYWGIWCWVPYLWLLLCCENFDFSVRIEIWRGSQIGLYVAHLLFLSLLRFLWHSMLM